jgi:NADPH-dependent 2,4-dienoyl-CoA reductase/sulfur reductase-like enzyme
VPGSDSARVLYLRDIADALALRERLRPGTRLAVIGAGFIGLEVTAIARARGCAVAVLEMAPEPLSRVVAPEIGAFFAGLHRNHGVDLRTAATVSAIEESGDRVSLVVEGGEPIAVDLVLAGIGAVPNTELAADAGLAVENGVVVDEFGRSSDPAIFAAGDVTNHHNPLLDRRLRLEAWQNAQNQAIAVAKVMGAEATGGSAEAFAEVPWFWTDQYDVNLQIAGAPESWDRLVWRGAPTDRAFTLFYLKDNRVVGANAVNNARDIRFAKMLIAGRRAVDADRLGDMGLKLQDLARP